MKKAGKVKPRKVGTKETQGRTKTKSEQENAAKSRTEVLIEALPYIDKFRDKVFLIKVGGSTLSGPERRMEICKDIAILKKVGMKIIVVHGGGAEISKLTEKLGKKVQFIDGLRYTDEETLGIAKMALGKVNSELVTDLQAMGCNSVGITGESGKLAQAKRMEKLGFVGKMSKVDPRILESLLDDGIIPVIQPIGVDQKGESVNINADEMASAIAKSLKVEKLIFMTDVPGLLEDKDDETSLISRITTRELKEKISWLEVHGGMIPKARAVIDAIESGVNSVHMIDGRKKHSLLLEVFTDEGFGTMVTE